MLHVLGAMLIVFGCGILGYGGYSKLVKKEKLLLGLLSGLEAMRSEIVYKLAPVDKALEAAAKVSLSAEPMFMTCLEELGVKGAASFADCWTSGIETLSPPPEAAEVLQGLLFVIGRYSAEEQKESLDFAASRLKRLHEAAEEERKRQGKIYISVGLSCGIVAAIVLI